MKTFEFKTLGFSCPSHVTCFTHSILDAHVTAVSGFVFSLHIAHCKMYWIMESYLSSNGIIMGLGAQMFQFFTHVSDCSVGVGTGLETVKDSSRPDQLESG